MGFALTLVLSLGFTVLLSACACSSGSASGDGSSSGASASAASLASSAPASSSQSGPASQSGQVVNPLREVFSLADLNALGMKMSLPVEATQPSYYLIGDAVAEVDFIVNDTRFTYRGSPSETDIAGVYEDFSDAQTTSAARDGVQTTLTIDVAPSGTLRATWSWPEGSYALTATGSVPRQSFTDIALQLAQTV
jgi:hypothetical protein